MRTVAIIQARMGSTRLPGKSLLKIGGKPLIWHVVERVRRAKGAVAVVLATTTDKSDDRLAAFAEKNGIPCFRGDVEDVLDRFYRAAKANRAGAVVRITGDSPLVDPQLIDKAVSLLASGRYDYVSNSRRPWMDGFDVEAFTFAALEKAWKEADMVSQREHVTPFIRDSGKFRASYMENDPALDGVQCSVDRKEDLEFVREVYRLLGERGLGHGFSYLDVIALLRERPALRKINAKSVVNEGYFKSLREDRKAKVKFLVIGCGSIGRRHARNLLSLGHDVEVADITEVNRKWAKEELKVPAFADAGEALGRRPDAALICTPTATHVKFAIQALESGAHVFIEKPISHSLEGLGKLEAEAKKRRLAVLVACNLRFSSAFSRITGLVGSGKIGKILYARMEYGNYLPSLRKVDYRKTYAAGKVGGGVLLDDVHSTDLIVALMGRPEKVACRAGNTSGLGIRAEDFADTLLCFKGNRVASVHSDYFQRSYQRTAEIVGDGGTIVWQDNLGLILLRAKGSPGLKRIRVTPAGYENEMYVREMLHFIRCMEGKEKPVCGVRGAADVLRIVLAAKESSQLGKTVKV